MRLKVDLAAAVAAAQEHPATPLTLAELVAGYAAAHSCDYDQRLAKWLQAFAHVSAWAVTPEQLDAGAQALLAGGYKPSTVNRDLSALGSCYRWAKARRLSPRGFVSPTLNVQRYDEGIRRVEVCAQELADIRARSLTSRDRRFGVFVHLLIDTGARKSELLQRRWAELNLEQGQILCPTTKTGVPRVLHFRPETGQLIQRICKNRNPEKLIFEGRVPGEPISYKAAWARLVADVGRPDLHMHDMRHAAAANLLRAGVTLGVAAQVLGHDPAVLARRYGHLETQTLRRAQEQAWEVSHVE